MRLKRLLGVGAAVVAILIAAIAMLLHSAWLRGFVEQRIAGATGRDVSIGSLDIHIGRCLGIEASDLRIGNPTWAHTDQLIDAGHIATCFAWLPLLRGHTQLDYLQLSDAKLGLERDEGRATWAFNEKEDKGQPPPVFNNVRIHNTLIHFRDSAQATELDLRAEGGTPEHPNITLRASGRVRHADVDAVFDAPAALPSADAPVIVSMAFTLGHTTGAAAGRLRSLALDGIEAQLVIAGDDLSDLNRLDITLPKSPPYALRGRLRNQEGKWSLEPFEGRIGDSDVAGRLAYAKGQPHARLDADLSSKLLDLDDLGPLIGAPPKTGRGETASAKQKREAQEIKHSNRVLPDKPLGIDKWFVLDADVHFRAERVKRPGAVPIDALDTRLRIENAVLQLQPLNFEVAGGTVASNIRVDGNPSPPRAAADFDVRNIHLAKMLPKLSSQEVAVGTLFGRAKLAGRGTSIAQLLGGMDGDLTHMVNGGQMSAILLEAAGLDIAEVVKFLTIRDKPVPLRCAVADLHVTKGAAKTELLVIDTVDTIFIGEGEANLAREQLDLTIYPRPKDESILALRSPLHIEGSFSDPHAGIKAGPLAAKAAAAVALGLLNPVLAIAPLIETGPGKDSDCGEFSRRVRQTPRKNAPADNKQAVKGQQ
jgi:uncharacterized protein involved in outer membrane biogenesis